MLTVRPRASALDVRSERGFTLIELLVAMISGLVVTGALLAILEISLRQDQRISDRVQADRVGRTAMGNMLDELRSACTGFGSTAIQAIPATSTVTSPLAATNATNLWFLTAYGSSTSGAALTGITEHDINWTASGTTNTGVQLGTLTDYAFLSTGGEPPTSPWTFNSTLSAANASSRVLAKNVIVPSTGLFRYYKYDTNSKDAAYGNLVETTAFPLTIAEAKLIAQVDIAFEQAPDKPDTRIGHTNTTEQTGSIVLRLSPTESSAEGAACA